VNEATVREIGAEVYALRLNYALWWAAASPEIRARSPTAFKRYGAFFDAAANSFFRSVVIAVYQLMDERNDVSSLPRFLSSIRTTHPNIVSAFEEQVRPIRPIYERMAAVRHKVLAHRDRALAPDTVYELAQLTPPSINACIAPLHDIADCLFATFVPGYCQYQFWEEIDRGATGAERELHELIARTL